MLKAISNIGSQVVGKGLAIAAWTSLLAIVGKGLTAQAYGQFMLLNNLAAFVVIIASFGQPQVLLALNGKSGDIERTSLHRRNFISCGKLMLVSSIPIVFLFALGLHFFSVATNDYLLIISWAGWVLFGCFQALFAEEARSVSKMWRAGLFANSGAVGGAATIAVSWAAISMMEEYLTLELTIGVLGATSLLWFMYLWYTYESCEVQPESFAKNGGKVRLAQIPPRAVKAGTFVTLNLVTNYVLSQSDLWWVVYWLGEDAAGSYGTAAYLARFCSMCSILFSAAYIAKCAGYLANGKINTVSKSVRRLGFVSFVVGITILTTFTISYEVGLLQKIFKIDSNEIFYSLVILGFGHTVGSLFGFGPVLLSANGNFKELFMVTIACAGLTIIFTGPLLLIFGVNGIAVVFSLAYIVFTMICTKRCVTILNVRPFNFI